MNRAFVVGLLADLGLGLIIGALTLLFGAPGWAAFAVFWLTYYLGRCHHGTRAFVKRRTR